MTIRAFRLAGMQPWQVQVTEDAVRTKLAVVMLHLDERQRRILAGAQARALGMSRPTVHKAVAEIDAGIEPSPRVRRPGGGRKALTDLDKTLFTPTSKRWWSQSPVGTPSRRRPPRQRTTGYLG